MQFGNFGVAGTPQVDAATESDSQCILVAPVEQVQVIIVLKRRRVKHLEWSPGDLTLLLVRRRKDGGLINALETDVVSVGKIIIKSRKSVQIL